jgi:hypothetical protein
MKGLFIAAGIAFGFSGMAQQSSTANVINNNTQVYRWTETPEEDGSNLQKKFIKQEWTSGTVKFKSGRPDMDVKMIFDVHNDIPYYLLGNSIMEFVDPVSEFRMLVPFKKDSMNMIFRNNYPPIQANTENTYYQVMVEGKIQLLKCMSKSILLFKDTDKPEERKKDPSELYFAYMPGKKIVQISFDAAQLMASMPEYEWAIKDIMKKEKIKLKDEAKLMDLFVLLNSQFQ